MAKLPLGKAEQLVRRVLVAMLDRRDGAIADSIASLEARVAYLERQVSPPAPLEHPLG